MLWTDLARITIAATILTFAAATDLKWRRAPDACWILLALAGALLLAIDALTQPNFFAEHLPSLIAAALVLLLALIGYVTGLIAGGADAKALASLALAAPLPLTDWSLLWPSLFPLALTTLVNALLATLLIPLGLGVWNLAHGHVDGARTVLGFKTRLENVDEKTLWPLEHIDEDGNRSKAITPRGLPPGLFDPDTFRAHDQHEIWVTPKLPFLVSLGIGFALAVLAGDPLTAVIERVAA